MDGQASHVGRTCGMVNWIHGLSIYQSTALEARQSDGAYQLPFIISVKAPGDERSTERRWTTDGQTRD